jgi:uncharacterized protein YjbI with pentapeptide repeats
MSIGCSSSGSDLITKFSIEFFAISLPLPPLRVGAATVVAVDEDIVECARAGITADAPEPVEEGGADVEGAGVEGADVEGADVEGADVEGADVEGAGVEGAGVEGAAVEAEVVEVVLLEAAWVAGGATAGFLDGGSS